nr:vacuolar protein sorting-associated protein vts1 [Quercus suber]
MASNLPSALKNPELTRFATRAAQLAKFRPIVTYWLEYYILQTILQKSLHTVDDDCSAYAVQLMDKLETYKSANASEPAITDDVTAKAYVESFALETFSKADVQQTENRVGKQTADTFMAAATFLDLLAVWGPLEEEARAKSKFAKFHALRIAKALKSGEDPNATNPVIEKPPAHTPADDGLDAELEAMSRQQNGAYQPPTVEDAEVNVDYAVTHVQPDAETERTEIHQSSQDLSAEAAPEQYKVSPMEAPLDDTAVDESGRQSSIGGGYFPATPGSFATETVSNPEPEAAIPDLLSPSQFYNSATPTLPAPTSLPPSSADRPSRPPPEDVTAQPPPLSSKVPVSTIASSGQPQGGYNADDEAVAAAQKHAKWAISALNFDDVNTAVKELKIALAALGAT